MKDRKVPELEMKIHIPEFLKEVFNHNPTIGGVMKIPVNTLQNYLLQIAERASQLNDPKLNALMCQTALYAIADPHDKENHDPLKVAEIISKKYDEAPTLLEQNRELKEALRNSNQRIRESLRQDAAKWGASFKAINDHVNSDLLVKSNEALLNKLSE